MKHHCVIQLFIAAALALLTVQLTVKAANDIDALIKVCSGTVKGITEELTIRYRANDFPDDPVTHCFVRCFALTLNLYDDGQGVDLPANWAHLGRLGDEAEFVTKHRICLEARALESIEDLCDRAYSAFQCLRNEYESDRGNKQSNDSGV